MTRRGNLAGVCNQSQRTVFLTLDSNMKVSIVATVKNEGEALRPLLDSILDQTRPPDEVVICDGGSVDATPAILDEYTRRLPLRVIVAPGSNISQGRNRAIAAATGDIIAATDAGVVLSPTWLEELHRPVRRRIGAGRRRLVRGRPVHRLRGGHGRDGTARATRDRPDSNSCPPAGRSPF
jgi:glycosyltransferase involved in cell wall biosynthesis